VCKQAAVSPVHIWTNLYFITQLVWVIRRVLPLLWVSHTSVTKFNVFVPVRYALRPKQMFLRQSAFFVSCEIRLKKELSIRWNRMWILWRLVTCRAGGQDLCSYSQAWRSRVHVFLLYNFLLMAERRKIRLGSVTLVSEFKTNLKCPMQVDKVTVLVSWYSTY